MGVNYYQPRRVKSKESEVKENEPLTPESFFDFYDMPGKKINPHRGWEIYEKGIYDLSINIRDNYKNIPFFISENGMGVEGEEKFKRILKLVRILADNPNIEIDEEVYASEKSTGDRNRAIAYIMKSKGIIKGDVDSILDSYFKQCSISVDTIDLANIARNISNRFRDIEIKENIDKTKMSRLLIAIMTHSGMYNFSGRWSVEVGIPSKSGVAGGILSVVPDKYGIGFFGPSLDKHGNPLLGYKVLKELSKELNINIF